MLQLPYSTSSKKGFDKKQTAPLAKRATQKTLTRLLIGQPTQLSPSALHEYTQLYHTLQEHDIPVTCIQTDSCCPRYVTIHHPAETGRQHPFGILYSSREPWDEKVLLYIQQQYSEEFQYYDMQSKDSWAYVEGQDSLVFDRSTKTIYAHLSPHTYYWKLFELQKALGYKLSLVGYSGHPYTSALLAVGQTWAVLYTEGLWEYYQKAVVTDLQKTKKVLEINTLQMHNHCTSLLEVRNSQGKRYVVMSSRAYAHFTEEQKAALPPILHVPLDTVEAQGGNLRRCLLEI